MANIPFFDRIFGIKRKWIDMGDGTWAPQVATVQSAADGTQQTALPPGKADDSASVPVTSSNQDTARIGSITETAPASDTASSGLNGRLQRVAQNLTTINTSALPAKTTTNRSLAASATAASAMAANTSRRGWKVKNDSTIDIYINFATTATAAAGSGNMKVAANGGYLASEPGFVETAAMSIIAASGTPAITIYEFS